MTKKILSQIRKKQTEILKKKKENLATYECNIYNSKWENYELKDVFKNIWDWRIESQLHGKYRDHMSYIEQNEKTNKNVNTVTEELN